jgi:type II secretory pathway predicted ATPase ExeA
MKASSRPRPRVTDDCWSRRVEGCALLRELLPYRRPHRREIRAHSTLLSGYVLTTLDVTVGARRERWRAMDHDQGLTTETSERPRGDSPLAVSSRRRALDRLRAAALAGQARPILITGEPGAGKTWLADQLGRLLPSAWRSTRVDLTRAMTALDFLQLVGHSLGVPLSEGLGATRARLNSILHDDDVDGRRWLLFVDEAHHASPVVWDEIQALVNQLGRPGGFAAVVVLGDTELVRSLTTRAFGGFASSVRIHLHLPPLDLDEARELLVFTGYDHVAAGRALEELYRDARGNPGSLIRLAQRRPGPWRVISDHSPEREPRDSDPTWPRQPALRNGNSSGSERPEALDVEQTSSVSQATTAHLDRTRPELLPSLIPAKPPIRDEDGLVEVGWDGDLESELVEPESNVNNPVVRLADDSSLNEELVEDRYAALQAWSEWTERQGRTPSRGVAIESPPPRRPAEPSSPSDERPADESPGSLEPAPAAVPPGIRAEPQHEFAPYSQLFTRLRPSKQP